MLSKPHTRILPVLALLAAASFWGMLWYPLRWLDSHGMPGVWATLVLFGAALVAGVPLLWRHRALALRYAGLLTLLGLANGWCNVAFVLAVLDGTVVRVLLLFYLSPVWAVFLGRVLLGERMPPRGWVVLVVALAGAAVILWDPSLGLPWPRERADWLAISSGLAFALSNVLVRKGRELPGELPLVCSWLGVVVLTGAAVVAGLAAPLRAPGWGVLGAAAALGLGGVGLMTALLVYGVRHMPVHRSAVILLFEVVAGAVSSHWLGGEVMGPREWIGGLAIVSAAWMAATQAPEAAG